MDVLKSLDWVEKATMFGRFLSNLHFDADILLSLFFIAEANEMLACQMKQEDGATTQQS